jgi:SAM-dependent methyltransferase
MGMEDTDYMDLDPQARQARLKRYAHNSYPQAFKWNWGEVRYNRIALVNRLLRQLPEDAAYLEIGCDRDVLFNAVPTADKTGVDPSRGGTLRMTSDAFFATNGKVFDLVWIDGLHEYRQVHRDLENALACLNPGGWIALHDMLPLDWRQEHMPRVNVGWTGDVWKVAFEIAATRGLEFRIALIDHGVGILRADPGHAPLADMSANLAESRFGYLYENIGDLPVIPWDEAVAWIAASN